MTNVPPRTLARSKPQTAAGACEFTQGGMMNATINAMARTLAVDALNRLTPGATTHVVSNVYAYCLVAVSEAYHVTEGYPNADNHGDALTYTDARDKMIDLMLAQVAAEAVQP